MKKFKKIQKIHASLPHDSPEGSLIAELYYLIEEIIDITKPKNILEIGFNIGFSAVQWLELSKAKLVSIDICRHPGTLPASKEVSKLYPKRFEFINCDSTIVYPQIKDRKFDLIFIDGNHFLPGPISDLFMAYALGAKWVLVDDYDMLPVFQSTSVVLNNQYYTIEKEFDYMKVQGSNKKILLLKRI